MPMAHYKDFLNTYSKNLQRNLSQAREVLDLLRTYNQKTLLGRLIKKKIQVYPDANQKYLFIIKKL